MHLVIAELEARVVELEEQLVKERAAAERIKKAWKASAARLKQNHARVTEVRRNERVKLHAEQTVTTNVVPKTAITSPAPHSQADRV